MGYAAWHSSFIPPGSLVRSPLTVPGRHKGLRPCGGMYPLTQVGFWKRARPSVGAREVRSGGGGLYWGPRPGSWAHLWGNAMTPPAPAATPQDTQAEALSRRISVAMGCTPPCPHHSD